MLENLKKHHIGIVIDPDSITRIESRLEKNFHLDREQGVRVCFHWNSDLGLYEEYITREGKAKNYSLGFHHICYEVPSISVMAEVHQYIKENRLGFRLGLPVMSGSEECGQIVFYKLKNNGIVEFTIQNEAN